MAEYFVNGGYRQEHGEHFQQREEEERDQDQGGEQAGVFAAIEKEPEGAGGEGGAKENGWILEVDGEAGGFEEKGSEGG